MSHQEHPQDSPYDVVIVGAGAAGLSAAVMLGRSKRRVLVVSLRNRRNSPADRVNNVPFAHGTPPAEVYAKMESDADSYGVEFIWDTVLTAQATDEGVTVGTRESGTFLGERLLLATGPLDRLPAWIPQGEWGRTVFDCPYCHTREHDGAAFVAVGAGEETLQHALLCRQYANSLTAVVTDPDSAHSDLAARLVKVGAQVLVDTVLSATTRDEGGVLLVTEAGRELPAGAVVLDTAIQEPNQLLPSALGLDLNAHGFPRTTLSGRTSHPRVYNTGKSNPSSPYFAWTGAASSGLNAARAICEDIAFG
ncbi:NAD(P)/FAD-dependent oxidoreductase [Streptomyces sp. NPDC002763]|uniref:NAD(P)/FAD-dependent oxidoreductase n=1 Tax=Streptomyces sp. NPDC002763 TaxID=3154427 RepID=UPI00331A9311